MDDQLRFLQQSPKQMTMGINKRTFISLDGETLPIVYKCQVRPHLEYGNVIWNPQFLADTRNVEAVQHLVTKKIPSLQYKPYQEHLKILKLYSMDFRR